MQHFTMSSHTTSTRCNLNPSLFEPMTISTHRHFNHYNFIPYSLQFLHLTPITISYQNDFSSYNIKPFTISSNTTSTVGLINITHIQPMTISSHINFNPLIFITYNFNTLHFTPFKPPSH